MMTEEYIENKRAIQASLLNYIENEDDDFQHLMEILNIQNILSDEKDLKDFIVLLNIISSNHHRSSDFFTKFEKLLHFISDNMKNKFSSLEIYQIFKNNKRILLYLFQENIVTLDKKIILDMYEYQLNYKDCYYCEYFSPEIRAFIDEQDSTNKLKFNKNLIQKISVTVPTDFNEKRKNGENDSYLCNLIRNDSIEDFIIYINKNNISFNNIITPSIYETNRFLYERKPSLIEYSTFYGSIQIFQYLRLNKANIKSELWLYSIHGRNAEIIQFLEDNNIKPPNKSFKKCLNESILCHHNNIANYIKDTLLTTNEEEEENEEEDEDESENDDDDVLNELSCIFKYHNYELFPNDLYNTKYAFYNIIGYHYSKLLDLFISSQNMQINLLNLDDYNIIKNEGSIYFFISILGSTLLVKNKLTGQKFILERSFHHFEHYDFSEYDILVQTRYPSLLQTKGFNIIEDKHEQHAVLLHDYYEKGSLFQYISDKIKGKISVKLNTKDYILILGISIGLKYLHDHDIVHVSFIPSCILIDDNFYPIIYNYGLSKKMLDRYLFRESVYSLERVNYIPPEVITQSKFNKSSNIYSLSFMIYQILTGSVLFTNTFSRYQFCRKVNGYRPDISCIQNDDITRFLESCWSNIIDERLTIDEVIEFITSPSFYSYFDSLDHESIKRYLDIYGDEFNNLKDKF